MTRNTPDTSHDQPVLGIMFMLGFCILAPLGDSFAKILGERLPLLELVTARFAVQLLLLAPLIRALNLPWKLQGRLLWLVVLRTMLHIAGIGMMFTSLRFLQLADAIAIAFVMPFIMLILGHYVLGEEVGRRRVVACVVGFTGTLMVIQPNFAEVGAPALLPLGVALVFSLFMLVTRKIARQTDPIALQAVSGGIALLVLLPIALIGARIIPDSALTAAIHLVPPANGGTWGLLLLIGVLGTMAHLLMTWSLRYAPSATLAPMQYLEIPFATAIGWLLFRDLPDGLAALGILVTVGAGLYVIWCEQASHKRRLLAEQVVPEP